MIKVWSCIVSVAFLFQMEAIAQVSRLPSKVNTWKLASDITTSTGSTRVLFDGSGSILERHLLLGHMIKGGKSMVYAKGKNRDELFFIIKEGSIQVSLNKEEKLLSKGSVVFVLPGEEVIFKNVRKDDVEMYEMRMRAPEVDEERGRAAGSSFMLDWYDMVYRPHDRGGVRQLFDRKTAMTNRFDIHTTSLNPGISSHLPHTHLNEEIILMIDGESEMTIGNTFQRIVTGDAAWVESLIPHNITNTAKRPAVYFAIQWN